MLRVLPEKLPMPAAIPLATPADLARPAALEAQIVLGFDWGERRLGVAIGNTLTGEARALAVIAAAGDARWTRVAALIESWQPAQLVVGVALHPDGAAHETTARCRRFANQLEGRFGRPVARIDERYSSAVVRDGRDDAAAAVILQQYLDERAAGAANPPDGLSPHRESPHAP